MKKRLLLLSQPNSYRIAPYLTAARKLGIDVLIGSRGEHSLTTEVVNGLHLDLDDREAALASIVREHRACPFAGIIGSDDSTVELAAMAARELGLPHNPPDAARLSRRKDLARRHLARHDCPVPRHCVVDLTRPLPEQIQGLPFPCVIKPLNMSASRGVIRADTADALIAACERVAAIISESRDPVEKTHVLVEEYIDGIEVACEAYLHEGKLHLLALFDKPDPLTGPFFEETIYVTPSRLDAATQERIRDRVTRACTAYGLITGPVHAELRIDRQDAWILEIASRTIGGDCARMLDTGAGPGSDNRPAFSLEQLTVLLAIGENVEQEPLQQARGVMMIPIRQYGLLRRVEGILDARRVEHVDRIDILIREGHKLIPLPEGNQYLGFIFASAEAPQDVVDALRTAHARLEFVTAPVWNLSRQDPVSPG